jgi:hypothetical protein
MPEIAIEFECDSEEEAIERAALDGNGEVTEDGNYLREIEVSVPQYQGLRNLAEADDEAEIQRVAL